MSQGDGPSDRRDPAGGARAHTGERPVQSVQEALDAARQHGRAAAGEALAALRALLDAAALASSGTPAAEHAWLARPAGLLQELAEELAGQGVVAESLLQAVAEALDVEIQRWEERAREDADARAVLRAFLGLREVLWEFGVRPGGRPAPRPEGAPSPRSARRPRVQRVRVEGSK